VGWLSCVFCRFIPTFRIDSTVDVISDCLLTKGSNLKHKFKQLN